MPLISVVVPCYNEEESLHHLMERLTGACDAVAGWDYEIILIDDGSADKTREIIAAEAAKASSHVRGVFLSRNHGHQLALSAGLTVADGERIFILDADLQDPPELLSDMMAKMDDGVHVVYGQRRKRDGETAFKKITAKAFYRVLNGLSDVPIPVDTGDFRLMSRKALNVLNAMPEKHRFIRGMVSWIGLRQEPLLYDRDARFAGETKYPLRKMISFAVDAITSFSIRPLKIASILGVGFATIGGLGLMYAVGATFLGLTTPGWASLISVILIVSSVQLLVLGLIGEYIGRLYLESKNRPLFIIEDIVGEKYEAASGTDENEVHKAIEKIESQLKKTG